MREFLMGEDAYTLHKGTRRGRRRRIIVNDIDEQWEMDLSDLPALTTMNDGYRYILCCIDVLSKYAWVLSLKRKTGPVLLEAIKKIIAESGRCWNYPLRYYALSELLSAFCARSILSQSLSHAALFMKNVF